MTASLPDGELVALCRAGDERAWHELVERFSRYVYAICHRAFSLSPEAAEDVFQEVFARTYESIDKVRDGDAIRAWIAQTTRRLCVDRLRAAKREQPEDEIELGGIDGEIESLEEAITVRTALATLPDHCQEMLDRFFARDQSYATIGAELEIPAGTIASRISRCLVKLRAALEGSPELAVASGGAG